MSRRARHHLLLAAACGSKKKTSKNEGQRKRLRVVSGNATRPAIQTPKPRKRKTVQEQMGELKFRAGLMLPTFSFRRSAISRQTASKQPVRLCVCVCVCDALVLMSMYLYVYLFSVCLYSLQLDFRSKKTAAAASKSTR